MSIQPHDSQADLATLIREAPSLEVLAAIKIPDDHPEHDSLPAFKARRENVFVEAAKWTTIEAIEDPEEREDAEKRAGFVSGVVITETAVRANLQRRVIDWRAKRLSMVRSRVRRPPFRPARPSCRPQGARRGPRFVRRSSSSSRSSSDPPGEPEPGERPGHRRRLRRPPRRRA